MMMMMMIMVWTASFSFEVMHCVSKSEDPSCSLGNSTFSPCHPFCSLFQRGTSGRRCHYWPLQSQQCFGPADHGLTGHVEYQAISFLECPMHNDFHPNAVEMVDVFDILCLSDFSAPRPV